MKKQDKKEEISIHKQIPLKQAVKQERALGKSFSKFNDYFNLFLKKANPKKNDKILDACCGGGYLTNLLYKKGFENIQGFDISPFSIKVAKKAYPKAKFFVSDAEDIDLTDNSIDIIFASNALHHFPDLTKLSEEFSRVLKKNGKVFAIEPNLFNPLNLLREIVDTLKGKKTKNEFPLSPRKVKKQFSKHFKVNISYYRYFTKLIITMNKK